MDTGPAHPGNSVADVAELNGERQVRDEGHSLEVRWLLPGQLKRGMAEWFGRFPAEMESRDDTYLLHPHMRYVCVKLRGGGAVDVKVYHGSPGVLDLPGRTRGRMECWQKWSFPCGALSPVSAGLASWALVSKRRRMCRFSPASARSGPCPPGLGEQPGCVVELTEIRAGGEPWWSLGFEATGPPGLLLTELKSAAALVFGQALPDGVEFGLVDSRSYAAWLRRRSAGA